MSVIVLSAVATGAFAASAAAATVQVASATTGPEQAIPVQMTLSGTADPGDDSNLQAVVRPAGGVACQPDYQSDLSATGSADTILLGTDAQVVAPGPYSVTATFKPPQTGAYQVCAWLTQMVGESSQTVAGPASVNFTASGPVVSQLSVTVPAAPTPNVAYQLDYTTQTDQQLALYSVIKQAGALPCASSFELEQEQDQPEKTLFGPGALQVFGGPSQTTLTDRERKGSYLICTWIEGPSAEEVDASLSTSLTIGTPAAPPRGATPVSVKLRLIRTRASRRHGVSASGTATGKAFAGRLLAVASCGSSRTQARPRVTHGRFTTHLALPRGCRGRRRLRLTVGWAGSSSFAKASAATSLAIGP